MTRRDTQFGRSRERAGADGNRDLPVSGRSETEDRARNRVVPHRPGRPALPSAGETHV